MTTARCTTMARVAWLLVWMFALPLQAAVPDEQDEDGLEEPATRVLARIAHPLVPGFERFHSEAEPAPAGRLLLGELNCTSCHQAEGTLQAHLDPKQAPVLDQVARRVKPDHLRRYLADPHQVKPGTTMPDVLAGVPQQQRAEQVEALVHFLVSLAPEGPDQLLPNFGAAERGRELFGRVGCAACHGQQQEDAPLLATSVPLGNPSEKYTLPSLTAFLQDPLHVRPSGRMPGLDLSGQEARDIASYLLKDLPATANVKYSYYEGNWNALPDFGQLQPVAQGGTSEMDLSMARRGDHFGLRFEGFLRIDQQGDYTFHLGSDDGSKLYVDGKLVVDNDGIHAFQWKSGRVPLAPGLHAVRVDYFEQAGEEKVQVEYEGPQIERQPLAASMTAERTTPELDPVTLPVDPALASRGRELVATLGCASCHQVQQQGQAIVPQLAAPPLERLRPDGGCLSDEPAPRLPDYRLSPSQRAALRASLDPPQRPQGPPTAQQQLAHTLTTLNCYACHQRDGRGGVERARNPWFQTTMPEMGDEGRIPPALDGVGAKLTAPWMKKILAEGANDRPYMHTRMPKFGEENAGHLAEAFAQLDTLEPLPRLTADAPTPEMKNAGWHLVGDKGFSCVKCHSFGPYQATGIQSIDLTVMAERLQENWFKRYLRNPQRFRRGTRMPSAWPEQGPSLLADVLDADSDQQIQAVWLYLSDGQRARTPEGLVSQASELIPFNEAILYRNFIEGAGTRAIGVGYPEQIHLAFDANQLRLALLWQGKFIDASRHWTGRGQGFEGPAGTNVLKLPDSVPLAILPDPKSSWPQGPAKELGYQFRGYRLAQDQRPTFLYRFQSVQVEDFPTPVVAETVTPLRRTLTLKADQPVENLWFRAAAAARIEPGQDGWYRIDESWNMRLETGDQAQPVLRQQDGQAELLVPIGWQGGQARLVQQFDW